MITYMSRGQMVESLWGRSKVRYHGIAMREHATAFATADGVQSCPASVISIRALKPSTSTNYHLPR
jgi:hypothetical protein